MSAAFKAPIKSTPKLVLLALCDCANDQGECYPSVPTLMEKCSAGERTVQDAIALLEREGYMRREFRTGRSTVYWIADPRKWPAGTSGQSHYVYRIEDCDTGEFYIGVRSCLGDPKRDGYMGSGAWFSQRTSDGAALRKTVLETFADREAAEDSERRRIEAAMADGLCRNLRTPANGAPRSSRTPQQPHPTPADTAPPPPQTAHPTPAVAAPITINEPSVEPSRKQTRPARKRADSLPCPGDIDPQVWADWLRLRKEKRATVSATVVEGAREQAAKAGMTFEAFLRVWVRRGTQGLEADWLKPHERGQTVFDRKAAEADKWMNPKPSKAEFDYIDMEATDAAPLALR